MPDRIARVEAIPTRIPFKAEFRIGRGQVGWAGVGGDHVFVRLETEAGRVGWGEVRALPAWSYETVEAVTFAIRSYFAELLVGRDPFELNAMHRAMYERITPAVSNGQPFAKAAVDIALHDLMGQIAGVPVHALLGGRIRDQVELTYALSIASPEAMAAAAREASFCSCFKVKVAGEPEADAERLAAISAAAPHATLWLDANQSYAPARVVPLLEAIRGVPRIFCLEQPVRSVDWLGMQQVRRTSRLPVAIDEGAFSSFDVARIGPLEAADLLVLKVCKSGGLRECGKSAAVAEANGIGLLGSGLTESGVGLAASVHFFSTIDTLLPPELNGPEFLADLLVEGLEIHGAKVQVPDAPGLGVRVNEAAIRENEIRFGSGA